jgi:hypothetical protein
MKTYDIIYSDTDNSYIAIPHINKESVKGHYDRINCGTSGLYASIKVDSAAMQNLIKTFEVTA